MMRKSFTSSRGWLSTPRKSEKFAAFPSHILAAIAALLICLNAQAFDFESDGFYYNILDRTERTVAITSGDIDYVGDIVIPSQTTYLGKQWSVVEIGNEAFMGDFELSSVVIPNSVATIGESAFSLCSSLASVEIPNSVTQIGFFAFSGCNSLNSVEIPNSVAEIDGWAFSGCTSLISVVIPNSVTQIGGNAFSGCTSLISVVIPNSVTEIGGSAFSNCSSLASVKIPNSVTKIPSHAFYCCSSLASVEIPNSVAEIDGWAFSWCSSLVSVEIPNSVTKIGEDAFFNCIALVSVEIPNSVTEIGDGAFSLCSSLGAVEIPNSVTSIGYLAFSHCTSLVEIYAQPTVPPGCDIETFDDSTYSSAQLYVPEESLEAYRTTDPWSRFVNIQVNGIEETEMEVENQIVVSGGQIRVNNLADGAVVEVYGADGREIVRTREAVVNGLPAGVYIVRIGNHSQTVRL